MHIFASLVIEVSTTYRLQVNILATFNKSKMKKWLDEGG